MEFQMDPQSQTPHRASGLKVKQFERDGGHVWTSVFPKPQKESWISVFVIHWRAQPGAVGNVGSLIMSMSSPLLVRLPFPALE